MNRRRSLRRRTAGLIVTLSATALLALPSASSADPVSDLIVQLDKGLNQLLNPGASTRQTPGSGGYTPPAHGQNSHAQGSATTVDITPVVGPLGRDPSGLGDSAERREEIILGRARAERFKKGLLRYHGHITILSLFGNELLGVDTKEGQTVNGGIELQAGLNQLCTDSAGAFCLQILSADSATDENSSANTFALANASLLQTGLDSIPVIGLGAVTSRANLSEDEECQYASSGSQVVGATVLGLPLSAATASSTASKCIGEAAQLVNGSSVIGLGGGFLPVPNPGCDTGTPNAVFPPLFPLLTSVCNADDTNGANLLGLRQLTIPYGVREALTLFLFDEAGEFGLGTALVKATTAGAETAVAGPRPAAEPPSPPPGDDGDEACPPDCPPGEFAEAEGLPVTGSDLVTAALIGVLALGFGLALRTAVARMSA
jgi:hypothetical protein